MRQEWVCEWEGLQIRVVNWSRGLRTGEELYVNDTKVDGNESLIWNGTQAYLAAPIRVNGSLRNIEVLMRPGLLEFKRRCRIFMDGQRIGGDMLERPVMPSEWAQTQSRGFVRYLFMNGILTWGLLFAAVITVANAFCAYVASENLLPFAGEVGLFTFLAVGYGGPLGYLNWRSLKKCFEGAESKLEGPPRFTI